MNTINVKLLNRVACAILDEPRKFYMGWYAQKSDDSPCGTVACIAGWAVALSQQYKNLKVLLEMQGDDPGFISRKAREVLALHGGNAPQLFLEDDWPFRFREDFHETQDPEDRADIAFWRIQHFIATNGVE